MTVCHGTGAIQPVTLNLFQGPSFATPGIMHVERQPSIHIIASKRYGSLYIGVTSDLAKRLWQHREGMIDDFTKRYAVHHLVRFELFDTMEAAITREKQLKNWCRQWKINLIEGENPDWHDLAPATGLPPIARHGRRDGT